MVYPPIMLLDFTPRQRGQALLSQARLMTRASWEASLRALAPSLDDPLLMIALARRLHGPQEALKRVHTALDEADQARVAGGVQALGAWLAGAGNRDTADGALASVEGGLRAWIVLMYLCVDLSDAHEQDVLDSYADGIAEHDEPPLSPPELARLRGSLFDAEGAPSG